MRKVIYKETNEDWYPSFEMNSDKLLRVVLCKLSNKHFRVCVWGADDFGMERDYPFNHAVLALETFEIICKLEEPLTRKFLKDLGFKNA
jgi:hypothetical protein